MFKTHGGIKIHTAREVFSMNEVENDSAYNSIDYQADVLPLIPLKGLTIFPHMILHFDVGRKKSVLALEQAMVGNQQIFLLAQSNPANEEPKPEDLYKVGTISKVKQLLKLPGGGIRVLVEGKIRAKVIDFMDLDPFIKVRVDEIPHRDFELDSHVEALLRSAKSVFGEYFHQYSKLPAETMVSITNVNDPGMLADIIASNMFIKNDRCQEFLEEFDGIKRLEKIIVAINHEIEVLELERNINSKVKKQMDKTQREYFLREQIKVIQSELGDGIAEEQEAYKKRIRALRLPSDVKTKLYKEVDRLSKMSNAMSETSLIRTYIETVLDLPWNRRTKDNFNITKAEKILDADHYGLEKVKERILEYLSVKYLTKSARGPILCLVGPPGVGKTSVAKSVAKALGRKFSRISLGGIRDEAEIRGHRRTYIGAMPGRIINSVKQAGSKNAFILLDEIDKMCSDFRGDPAAALLEALDPEQNFSFRDHYIEFGFDLSDIFFMTTANSLDSIPRPLLDRMEVMQISGYTTDEKYNIAMNYLVPKQKLLHGLKSSTCRIDSDVIYDVIDFYTRESGVRGLEREIAKICRKTAKNLASGEAKKCHVSKKNLKEYLGRRRYNHNIMGDFDQIGVATGLAWTSVGGEILSVEVNVMNGTGKIQLTGKLGDVMQESAKAALSYIRSKCDEFSIDKNFYKEMDIHIHVPEGATPKDGPSAGITIGVALLSALTKIPVRRDIAMTGEITLRGRVLPIGGLKEKALAAHRAGIKNVIIPSENERDLEDIPENIRNQMNFFSADSMDSVIKHSLSFRSVEKIQNPYFGAMFSIPPAAAGTGVFNQ